MFLFVLPFFVVARNELKKLTAFAPALGAPTIRQKVAGLIFLLVESIPGALGCCLVGCKTFKQAATLIQLVEVHVRSLSPHSQYLSSYTMGEVLVF